MLIFLNSALQKKIEPFEMMYVQFSLYKCTFSSAFKNVLNKYSLLEMKMLRYNKKS